MFDKELLLKRLRQAREDARLTHEEVAKNLGYNSSSTIGNYEAGRREISAKDLIAMAKLYDVSLSWLYGQNDEKDLSLTKVDRREWLLLLAFRKASERDKTIIENILNSFPDKGDDANERSV
ncbi:MAG: helix-turn-helix transcriptional regulator [Sporomusaceae bacterium]|nr:helix-turn-helix transcriptional regulator [Sporomusaceae bacterium]